MRGLLWGRKSVSRVLEFRVLPVIRPREQISHTRDQEAPRPHGACSRQTLGESLTSAPTSSRPSKGPAGHKRKGEVSNSLLPAHPRGPLPPPPARGRPETPSSLPLPPLHPQLLPREPRRSQVMSPSPGPVYGRQPGRSSQALGGWSLLGTVPSPTPPPTEHRPT